MLACIANELLCICLRSGDGSSLWQGILIRGSELRRKSALGIRKNLIARRRRSPQTFSLFDVRGYLGALTKDAKSILAMCRTDEARHRAEDAGNEPLRSGTTRHGALQRGCPKTQNSQPPPRSGPREALLNRVVGFVGDMS